ncbi:MAG: glutamine-hydrolyzing carbamoyl-phosphate synthase small subunit [Elusimicrobia bacterium]|nr:glutamine-hydrolyzing carbamoyl-phosphate synthase small subunit [Elusimicrobiota bacterium]
MQKRCILALESGRIFIGNSFGYEGERDGEIVFNTSLSGYQEILTDPSYCGQIVCMTNPHIGNYGINPEDMESSRIHASGFVVKEASAIVSNWRSTESLSDFLSRNKVIGLEGIDTRALTRHIRQAGAMRAVISTTETNPKKLIEKAKKSRGLVGRDLVREVTCAEKYLFTHETAVPPQFSVALLDCGCKSNIARELAERGCAVTVFPATATAEDILAINPTGIMLSNGPGDPAAVTYVIETVKKLIAHIATKNQKLPLFGICLGHQMLGLALGAKTYKLKFGHRGANHPVKDLTTGAIEITSQNHGFCVDEKSLRNNDVAVTHCNLYDGTLEGIAHKHLPIFSVQYHPEASPGPHDASYLFGRFLKLMEK